MLVCMLVCLMLGTDTSCQCDSPSKALNHECNISISGADDQVQHVVSNVAAQLIRHKTDFLEVGRC